MQFIEQLLGFAPDGGNGALEAVVLLGSLFALAVWSRRNILNRASARPKS